MSIDEILNHRPLKNSIAGLVGRPFSIAGQLYHTTNRCLKGAACTGLAAIALAFAAHNLDAAIIHVDKDASGLNDGTSWVDAYNHLQDALADAKNADITDANDPYLIKVAQGTYWPDSGGTNIAYDREATFQLIDNVIIRGGFAGIHERDPNSRDITLYETVLSGDLRDNDVEVLTSWGLWGEQSRAENSYHVVFSSRNDKTSVLDGFKITGGNADGPLFGEEPDVDRSLKHGAGIYIFEGSPTIMNCTFTANSGWSGGIYNERSDPNITDCNFTLNLGLNGGGMYNNEGSPTLINCIFTGNNGEYGGGMLNWKGSPTLSYCTFRDNRAEKGGAMYNFNYVFIKNCNILLNFASLGGGISNYVSDQTQVSRSPLPFGLYQLEIPDPNDILTLENCALIRNFAEVGGGMHNEESAATVINSIIWYNAVNQISQNKASNVTYINIEGGLSGEGNIDEDPLFVRLGYLERRDPLDMFDDVWIEGDYHLMSQAGTFDPDKENWTDPNTPNWILDSVTSPCIDAGDPSSPVGSEPLPNGNRINMGVYGGTYQASKSPIPK